MPTVGPMELVVILFLVMLIFGAGKIPEVGRSLGKGVREFRKAQSEIDELRRPLSLDSLLEPEPKSGASNDNREAGK